MNVRKTFFAAKIFCLLSIAGCGGQLYQVAPLPASAPPVISTDAASSLGIGADVLDGDQSIEQFEANLPMAGVIAVDLALTNRTHAAIDLNKLRFELSDAAGAKFKQITPKKALSIVMDYDGYSFYRVDARQRTQERYQAISLRLDNAIAPQEERRGFLFFETKKKSPAGGLTLSIKGAAAPISVQLK